MTKTNTPGNYMPQLDSLRAFAVLLVIIAHWLPRDNFLNRYNNNGISGVTLFFVLSGFLITGILLKSKEEIDKGLPVSRAFKTFYIRRALRIFPLYYLVISLAWIFNESGIRGSFHWHFFYASNYYFWMKWDWQAHLSHLWSLSEEEQFYLFWPAILFWVPTRKLPYVFVGAIIIAIVYRIQTAVPWGEFPRTLTPGSLDSFGIGALLAYGSRYKAPWFNFLQKRSSILILLLALLYFSAPVLLQSRRDHFISYSFLFYGYYFPMISAFFGLLILAAARGVTNPIIAPILNHRWVLYLGKISYGLYLVHNFVPTFWNIPMPQQLLPAGLLIVQILRFALLVAVCSLSWYLFEKPLLRLKKYFEYESQTAVPGAAAAVTLATDPKKEWKNSVNQMD